MKSLQKIIASRYKIILCFLFCWLQLGTVVKTVGADQRISIDSLFVDDGKINVSFHLENFLTDKCIRGLERGFTSQLLHHIQLWKHRGLFSQLIEDGYYQVSVLYDSWEEKFLIVMETEKRLTKNVNTLREACSNIDRFAVTDTYKLERDGAYYVSIETTFQPISDETYQDLRNWISGEVEGEQKNNTKRVRRGRLFSFLTDLMGFGDRVFSVRSRDFKMTEDQTIQFLE